MSDRPQGNKSGIFGLLFRETGLFLEQAFQWTDERSQGTIKWADERGQEVAKWADQRTQDLSKWADQRSQDAIKLVGDQSKADAEARLLEQMRLAKQAGLDVEAIFKRMREGK